MNRVSLAQTTCWTLISAAANGGVTERNEFVNRYSSVIRAYLYARWKNSALRSYVDDGCQDVFMECFQTNGPLSKVDPSRSTRFRTYLYGVVRNIALRLEQRRIRHSGEQAITDSHFEEMESDETGLEQVFDRAWAQQVLNEAAVLQLRSARERGSDAVRRVELLRLRFEANQPVRAIARRWNVEPATLHRELSKAKVEFRQALRDVVADRYLSAPAAQIDAECREIINLISKT